MKNKYIVCGDFKYYPWLIYFDNYEDALKYYKDMGADPKETISLCVVLDDKTNYLSK